MMRITRIAVLLGVVLLPAQMMATNVVDVQTVKRTYPYYRNAEPVLFSMKGIDYAIYPDGYMEFETRNGRRFSMYAQAGRRGYRGNRNGFIQYDRDGFIRRIGNMNVRVDHRGNIKRIGKVKIRYKRGVVARVGGLRVKYDRRGRMIFARGNVKYWIHGAGNQTHIGNDHWDQDPWDSGVYFEKNMRKRKELEKNRRDRGADDQEDD